MDKASKLRTLGILLLVALLVGAGSTLWHRVRVEQGSHRAEVALDYDSYSEYFHAQGEDEDQGFRDLRIRGASAVSFNENYLSTLQMEGHLKLYSGLDVVRFRTMENLPSAAPAVPNRQYLVIYDDATFTDLHTMIGTLLGADKVSEWGRVPGSIPASPQQPGVLEVVGSGRFLNSVGLGFSSALVEHFRQMGFHVVLRPENKTSVGPEMIQRYFDAMPPAEYVVFGGTRNEALGYPVDDCMDAVLSALTARHLRLGLVEVPTPKAALKGQEYLAQRDCQEAVRVQSIAPGQLAKLQPDDAIDMFRLGVRERNVRMIFLRPFADPDAGRSLGDTNTDYVSHIATMLRDSGFEVGLAATFPVSLAAGPAAAAHPTDMHLPLSWTLVLNLAVGLVLSLLVLRLWPQTSVAVLALGPVGMTAGALAAGAVHHAEAWSKLSALLAALAAPSLAMVWVQDELQAFKAAAVTPGRAVRLSLRWLGSASLISLGGGLLVASLLAYTPFMLEIDQFRGIKLLMILPPLLVLAYAALRQGTSLWAVVRQTFDLPLTVGTALCLVLVLAGAVFYVMRTGNTPETGASDLERTVRTLLEHVFVARPRFKDFCIGHPAFVLLGVFTAYAAAGTMTFRKPFMWLLLVLATIGQADIVDTFAHIHTPLLITLLRVFNGWWLGALVGIGVALRWRPFKAPPSRDPEASPAPAAQPALAAS